MVGAMDLISKGTVDNWKVHSLDTTNLNVVPMWVNEQFLRRVIEHPNTYLSPFPNILTPVFWTNSGIMSALYARLERTDFSQPHPERTVTILASLDI